MNLNHVKSANRSRSGFVPKIVTGEKPSPENIRILLVEDDEMVRALVATVLREAGYQFVEAADGLEGHERYGDQGPFDIVITDILMPRLSGVELAFRLVEDGYDGPVIFISAYADIARANDHVRQGRWHLIKKPFLPQSVLKTLDMIVGS